MTSGSVDGSVASVVVSGSSRLVAQPESRPISIAAASSRAMRDFSFIMFSFDRIAFFGTLSKLYHITLLHRLQWKKYLMPGFAI